MLSKYPAKLTPPSFQKATFRLSEVEKVEEALFMSHGATTWKEYLFHMNLWLDLRQVK